MTICRDVVTTLLQDGSCSADSALPCAVAVPCVQSGHLARNGRRPFLPAGRDGWGMREPEVPDMVDSAVAAEPSGLAGSRVLVFEMLSC